MIIDARLQQYVRYSVVPAMGAVTASLSAGAVPSAFYHCGDPAVSVERTFYSASPTSGVISASGCLAAGTHVSAIDE